jgi:predicted HTH domain antitoxin
MGAEHGTASFMVELPESLLTTFAETPEDFARELRLAAAIQWYREGRISQGKGAEIAGLSRHDFLDALFRARVPACQVSIEELEEEVDRAVQAHRGRLSADPADEGRAS